MLHMMCIESASAFWAMPAVPFNSKLWRTAGEASGWAESAAAAGLCQRQAQRPWCRRSSQGQGAGPCTGAKAAAHARPVPAASADIQKHSWSQYTDVAVLLQAAKLEQQYAAWQPKEFADNEPQQQSALPWSKEAQQQAQPQQQPQAQAQAQAQEQQEAQQSQQQLGQPTQQEAVEQQQAQQSSAGGQEQDPQSNGHQQGQEGGVGFKFDSKSGYWYDEASGYYYDANSGL